MAAHSVRGSSHLVRARQS